MERIVEEHLEAFEEALIGRVELTVPRVETVLLALDRSEQDELVIALGGLLSQRLSASLVVTGGFPEDIADATEEYISEVKQRLRNVGVEARALWPTGEESYDKILTTIDDAEADLLILPAPYFRDLESLGEESVGTNLDVILARSPVPVLVVRDPKPRPEEVLGQVRLAIYDVTHLSKAATEWAILLSREGRLETLAVVEKEVVELMEEALAPESVAERDLAERLSRELIPLVSAVLRRCDEMEVPCDVKYETEDLVEAIVGDDDRADRLIVMRGYSAHDRPGEKVARDVIPRTRAAVLVVKGSP